MYAGKKKGGQLTSLLVFFSLFAILLIHSSCFPIPVSKHSGGAVSADDVELLKPGKNTRSDVLLLLGNPNRREKEDRLFIYTWWTGILWLGPGAVIPQDIDHYFCIEFNETNQIKRYASFGNMEAVYKWFDGSED